MAESVLPRAIRDLAQQLSRLPGIGPKTAQRLALHLVHQPYVLNAQLAQVIKDLHVNVRRCTTCFNLAEDSQCVICRDSTRQRQLMCVVESPLDVEAIERSGVYGGVYHVLGGVLSPLEGISEDQLTIPQLFNRLQQTPVQELIIALDHTLEGEATTHYIVTHLKDLNLKITRPARGLPTGGDIEFADAMTLSAAFTGRNVLS